MWISRKEYDRIMERIGDLERAERSRSEDVPRALAELRYLRGEFRLLVTSLRLVRQHIPAKDAFVKE